MDAGGMASLELKSFETIHINIYLSYVSKCSLNPKKRWKYLTQIVVDANLTYRASELEDRSQYSCFTFNS